MHEHPHTRGHRIRALVLAASAAFAIAGTTSGPAPASPAPPLSHAGRWITDAAGRTVILHGFNVVAKGAPHLPSQLGFDADDAAFLSSEGFNTIRLGFDYGAIEPQPGIYDRAFLTGVANDVAALSRYGIFTLADVHQDIYTQRYGGNGMPDWMAIDNGAPNTPFPYPGNYPGDPAVQRAFDNFWANVAAPDGRLLQDHYEAGLGLLAAALAPDDRLLGYDIFNEPWPGSQYPTCASPAGCPPAAGFDATALTPFTRAAVRAVRSADRRHLVFYEPNLLFDFGANTTEGGSNDTNSGFSFHDYCLGAAPGLPAFPDLVGACQKTGEPLPIQNAEAHSAQTGDALLMTEFGATDDPAVAGRVADAADQHGIGWHFWAYINEYDGTQIPSQNILLNMRQPPTPDNLNQPLLNALVRAYPQVTAGTPGAYSFDAAKRRFDYTYSTKGPDGRSFAGSSEPTEIFVPGRFFGKRYAVTVSGAEVAGGLGSQLLALRDCPGHTTVHVTITAGGPGSTPSCGEQPSATPSSGVTVALSGPRPGAACPPRRSVRVRIKHRRTVRLRSATAYVNGKRVRSLHGRGLSHPIVIPLPGVATVRVRIDVRTASGRRLRVRRTYLACDRTVLERRLARRPKSSF
ncbi:MAG TPA: cellulase family glycosylhydrolase [Solirubrobacteraceae bacterium]|nr:cellulase family glycosylhydrolase [Solirubrobacteraceae bacterium]